MTETLPDMTTDTTMDTTANTTTDTTTDTMMDTTTDRLTERPPNYSSVILIKSWRLLAAPGDSPQCLKAPTE